MQVSIPTLGLLVEAIDDLLIETDKELTEAFAEGDNGDPYGYIEMTMMDLCRAASELEIAYKKAFGHTINHTPYEELIHFKNISVYKTHQD